MTTYVFDLLTDRDRTDDADADALFDAFSGDVTPGVVNGVPLLMCSVEADSLEQAVRPTVARLRALGVDVRAVQLEPDAVLA